TRIAPPCKKRGASKRSGEAAESKGDEPTTTFVRATEASKLLEGICHDYVRELSVLSLFAVCVEISWMGMYSNSAKGRMYVTLLVSKIVKESDRKSTRLNSSHV